MSSTLEDLNDQIKHSGNSHEPTSNLDELGLCHSVASGHVGIQILDLLYCRQA